MQGIFQKWRVIVCDWDRSVKFVDKKNIKKPRAFDTLGF